MVKFLVFNSIYLKKSDLVCVLQPFRRQVTHFFSSKSSWTPETQPNDVLRRRLGIYKLRARKKKREGENEGGALKSLMKKRGRTLRRKKREGESEGVRKKRPLFFFFKWGRTPNQKSRTRFHEKIISVHVCGYLGEGGWVLAIMIVPPPLFLTRFH